MFWFGSGYVCRGGEVKIVAFMELNHCLAKDWFDCINVGILWQAEVNFPGGFVDAATILIRNVLIILKPHLRSYDAIRRQSLDDLVRLSLQKPVRTRLFSHWLISPT